MMAAKSSTIFCATFGLLMATLAISTQTLAFPSLFNRPSLFRRQQQPQPQQQQHEQLVSLANTHAMTQQQPVAELMRISGLHQIGAHQMVQQQQQPTFTRAANAPEFISGVGGSGGMQVNEHPQLLDSASQAAAYFKPNNPTPEHQFVDAPPPPPANFEFFANSAPPTHLSLHENAALSDASGSETGSQQQLQLAPTHSNEVVDKIERHIEQQIEQGLEAANKQGPHFRQAAASGYYAKQSQSSGGGGGGEREPAASGEGESAGSEESSSSGGESGAGSEEPKAEKRGGEPEVKEEEKHHEEHPPEAFEIHHKKGGKSFQYFHQGHHH